MRGAWVEIIIIGTHTLRTTPVLRSILRRQIALSARCRHAPGQETFARLRISRKLYGEIGPAFYGLRTTLLTLLLMALLRIKRPEHLKERDPAAFGRLLGLDRAPEVKTLRRRLTRLAAHHRAEQLGAGACAPACRSARTSDGIFIR